MKIILGILNDELKLFSIQRMDGLLLYPKFYWKIPEKE